jgi:hypothetical protein
METTIEPNPIMIVDDNPTDEQLDLAFKKACKEFGDCVADYESDEFTGEFHDQLNNILNEEAVQGLIDKGLITTVVRDDGAIGYISTPAGHQVARQVWRSA